MRPDAQQLVHWADRLDCRAHLPELVRRLVHSTVESIEAFDFPAGEGVGRPGWDGRLQVASGNAFVPAGHSVWEMGCSQDPKKKANADYKWRTENTPQGVDRANTTFIFVTPRRWTGKTDRNQWVQKKREEGHWKDVRAYDADSLEQWLEMSPAASAWLAQVLGHPQDAQALDDYFEEWSLRTSPATPDRLAIAGRDDARAALRDWLAGIAGVVSIQAPEPGEVAAFVFASLRRLPGGSRKQWLDRALVVRSDATLRRVGLEGRAQLIIAVDCELEVARMAARSGNHVVLATSRPPAGARINLGELDRPAVTAALERLGLDPELAKNYSRESNGELTALRQFLGAPAPQLPVDMVPLLLVGGWDTANDNDVAAVTEIFGRSNDELERLVRAHSVGPGAAFSRAGSGVTWRSRLDRWRSSASLLTRTDLDRYKTVAGRVLSVVDPKFDLEPEERWMATLHGKVPPHSAFLRRSLAETASIMASNAHSRDHEDTAANVVHEVLKAADTWQAWATLDDLLPTMAEACPEAFLRHVQDLVHEAPDTVRELRASSTASGVNWSDHFNGLVWGLETLAWHPNYLGEACDLLAEIADLESEAGGDRAFRALREILLAWMPHTTASVEERIAVITRLARLGGASGLRLLLALLPQFGGDSSTGTHKPAWRSWLVDWKEGVDRREAQRTYVAVWDLVVDRASAEPSLWVQVLPHLHELSSDVHRPKALTVLADLDPTTWQDDDRRALWEALRHELHRHRGFPDTNWALPEEDLAPLDELYQRAQPSAAEERLGWLFAQNPELPDFRGHDWRERQEAIEQARQEAMGILLGEGLETVLLVAKTEEASAVGWTLGRLADLPVLREAIRESLPHEEPWARHFRTGIARSLVEQHHLQVLDMLDAEALPTGARVDLALGVQFRSEVWDRVEGWGEEAASRYWSETRAWLSENRPGELSRAVERLIDAGRAADAIDLLGMHRHRFKEESRIGAADIVRALTAALDPRANVRPLGGMDIHHAGELMDLLNDAGEEWQADLARLEWSWFQAMDRTRSPQVLFRALSDNPKFFVEVLSLVFRSDDDSTEEGEEEDAAAEEAAKARATNAYRLLNSWDVLPGVHEGGTVDAEHLSTWVEEARREARRVKRVGIADLKIGEVLARAPAGQDGLWPHEAVRDLIEGLRRTHDIKQGFVTGRRNQRGVFSKGIGEGGRQEREIASQYRAYADALRSRWPVTSRFLREIAEDYERDADREDERGARDKEAFVWAASNEDRLAEWVDSLQASGRYWFKLEEAVTAMDRPESEVKQACQALVTRSRLAKPADDFLVIVPLEFRSAGCPPASWFIDGWMQASGISYAVGGLTSAALHGAAHQQPQAFQVLVDGDLGDVILGRVRIQFVAEPEVGALATVELPTETGTMKVLTPEATAMSVVAHRDAAGGVDAAASVLLGLAHLCDADEMAKEAAHAHTATLQRLGFLLMTVEQDALAEVVAEVLDDRDDNDRIWLRGDGDASDAADVDGRWLVAVERPVELDR